MGIVRKKTKYTVVEAAYKRVENVFSNGVPIYLSMSGGKDSIVLSQIVYDLIFEGKINPKQLTVIFIDEEGMYDDVIEIVEEWRVKFLKVGAQFDWYCIQVKHFNCLNYLTADETWVCWDIREKEKWMRQPPPYAIREHPLLREGVDNYQTFLPRICADGITLMGVRAAESLMRLNNFAKLGSSGNKGFKTTYDSAFPTYDWTDKDIWLFIKDRNINIPNTYLYMYQVGVKKQNLRICNLFATDTIGALVHMAEYYPGLMEKITKREPNAYLVSLYWDTEMFGRTTKKRKINEQGQEEIDYKQKFFSIVNEPQKHFNSKQLLNSVGEYKKLAFKWSDVLDNKAYKQLYEGLIRGDTKLRTYRALITEFATKRSKEKNTVQRSINGHIKTSK